MARLPAPLSGGALQRLSAEYPFLLAALRVVVVLAAFYTAYEGVHLLEDRAHISRGIAYFAVACIMLVAAGWGYHAPSAREDGGRRQPRPAEKEAGLWLRVRGRVVSVPALGWWGLLIAAIGLGFAFRLYEIGSVPFGVWFDEAQNGIVARQILDDSSYRPVFVGGLTQLPALFFYVFAAGVKFVGHGVLALRSVTTAAGILTLFFVYLLARELFGHRVAVLSTFFLAVMRWHVNFSRFGMHGIFAPLFMAATFYFLVRGLKGKGAWNFLVAGLMAGIGLQGYFSFLLVPFVVALFLLHHLAFNRVLPWRKLVLGLALFGVVTAAVYAPVGVWALKNQDQFNQRTETLTITKDRSPGEVAQVVRRSTQKHLLMFNSLGDGNGRHNLPGAPMLDTYTGFLFILGVGLALWRWRDSGHFLMLVWVAVTLQGGIWSVEFEAPQAYRTVGLTPAIAMLAALPLGLLWQLVTEPRQTSGSGLGPWSNRTALWAMGGAAGLVTLFSLAQAGRLNFETYFREQVDRADVWAAFSADSTIVANEMKWLGPDQNYWLSTLFLGQPTIQFINPDMDPNRTLPFHWARDLPAHGSGPAVYLLDGSKEGFYDWLKVLYPEGSFRTYSPPKQSDPVVVYEAVISSEDVQSLQGLDAVYVSESGQRVSQREAALDLDWSAGAPVPLPLDAEWSGFLHVSNYRSAQLAVEAPGEVRLFLDGELVAEGEGSAAYGTKLFQGEHEIRVEAHVDSPGQVRLSWDDSPVPAEALFAYPLGGHGLLGSFYTNDNWEGEPALMELTPLIGLRYHAELSIPSPFSVIWQGYLEAPVSGEYRFLLETVDDGWVTIDGQEVVRTPDTPDATTTLTAGRHPIEVGFRNRGGFARIFLRWVPPGEEPEIIPPSNLSPR
jgi:4-amino-4-deoxy-L-arabinose transferase-like glycosyltransferase